MNDTWLGPRAVAAATGVSTDTLRHYERLKLLPSVTRTRAGYRRYPPASVERVKLIRNFERRERGGNRNWRHGNSLFCSNSLRGKT